MGLIRSKKHGPFRVVAPYSVHDEIKLKRNSFGQIVHFITFLLIFSLWWLCFKQRVNFFFAPAKDYTLIYLRIKIRQAASTQKTATEINRFQADEIFGKWLTTLFKSSWQGEKERLFIILKTKKAVIKKALHRYRRGHGFKSSTGLNFFQALFSLLLKQCLLLRGSLSYSRNIVHKYGVCDRVLIREDWN